MYQKGNADCEHCTTHQYDNTVTYNKHTSGPSGTTYYTEQRVVTTGGGGSPATISSAAYDSSVGSNNNQVIYEGTGNQTNFARISVTASSVLPHPSARFGTIIEICLSITHKNTRECPSLSHPLAEFNWNPYLLMNILHVTQITHSSRMFPKSLRNGSPLPGNRRGTPSLLLSSRLSGKSFDLLSSQRVPGSQRMRKHAGLP